MAKHERLFDKGDPLSNVTQEPKTYGVAGVRKGSQGKTWSERGAESKQAPDSYKGR